MKTKSMQSLVLFLGCVFTAFSIFAAENDKEKKREQHVQETLNICLDRAIEAGQLVRVKDLLNQKADSNASLNGSHTPLTWAAANGQQEIILELLVRGADDTKYCFHYLCDDDQILLPTRKQKIVQAYQEYLERVRQEIMHVCRALPAEVIDLIGKKMWVTDDDRALALAVQAGEHEKVHALLGRSADVNVWCYKGPSLYLAAMSEGENPEDAPYQKQLAMMRLLLDHRANPDQRSYPYRYGKVAAQPVLYELADEGKASRVALLLEHKANTEIIDGDGKQFIDYALDHERIMKAFKDSGRFAELQEKIKQHVKESFFEGSREDLAQLVTDYVAS